MKNVSFLQFFLTFPLYLPIYSRGHAKHPNSNVDRGGGATPNWGKGVTREKFFCSTKAVACRLFLKEISFLPFYWCL